MSTTTNAQRWDRIVAILEAVDNRCMVAEGPVTKTRYEITDSELRAIYELAVEREPVTRPQDGDEHWAYFAAAIGLAIRGLGQDALEDAGRLIAQGITHIVRAELRHARESQAQP